MNQPDLGKDGPILRRPEQSLGMRRLPLASAAGTAVADIKVDPASEKLELREIFAEELEALASEVRAHALADSKAKAERELSAAREALKAELSADFAKQLKEEQLKLDTQRQQLLALADALETEREKLTESMLPTVTRVSMAVVLRMLGAHGTSRALVGDLARHAIDEHRLEGVLRIRVSEADYQAISDGNEEQEFVGLFQIDRNAAVGDCVIDFGTGLLDASLDTQLNALKTLLVNAGGVNVGSA